MCDQPKERVLRARQQPDPDAQLNAKVAKATKPNTAKPNTAKPNTAKITYKAETKTNKRKIKRKAKKANQPQRTRSAFWSALQNFCFRA
jgi:hypothetical protein